MYIHILHTWGLVVDVAPFVASANVNFWPQQVARPSWLRFEVDVQSKLTKSVSTKVFVPVFETY